jgi:glutamate carboxypeptidase
MSPISISRFEQEQISLIQRLKALVELESPTLERGAVNKLGGHLSEQLKSLGAQVTKFEQQSAGHHWLGTWGDQAEGGFLVLCHMDTVHPLGTLDRFPWQETDDHLLGPGVLDMKASIAMALTAMHVLLSEQRQLERRVSLLITSDEETGSRTSSELLVDLAKQHEIVLCLEPALPDGSLKTWRKGTGIYELQVHGKPAHAGANPEDGVNAILEMSHQIKNVTALANAQAGTSVNVGQIRGGTRTNVIPAYCEAKLDVRVQTMQEQERLGAAFQQLTPVDTRAEVVLSGGWNRPPMPRSELLGKAFSRAQQLAEALGFEVAEGGTGGGSDANFVAPLQLPLLDGLGSIGGGAHTEDEFVLKGSLAPRTALLAAILSDW